MSTFRRGATPPDPASAAAEINRDYYEGVSAGRDDYWRKMAAPRHRMAVFSKLLRFDRPDSLVDLGCGNGVVLERLSQHLCGPELAGVDLSETQIAENRRRRPDVEWAAMDLDGAARFPAAWRGRFQAILATEVIEHLDHPEDFLRSVRQLAVPGRGRVYLSTQSGALRETERRVGHRLHFSAGELTALLSKTGWRVLRTWNTGYPFHDLSKWYANLDPDKSMQRFGERPYGWSENLVCAALRLMFRLNSSNRGAQLFAVAERTGAETEAA